jgi:hypothetical protein
MRQLLISSGGTVAYDATTGLLAPGAIDVVGLSADGPTTLTPGQTISDFSAIRLIQGTVAGRANVVSPWIDGSSVSRWVGESYAAQQAQSTTLTFATVPSAGGTEMSIKVIDRAIGQAQFQRASASFTTVAGALTVHRVTIGLFSALTGVALGTIAAATNYAIPGMDRVVAQVNSTDAGAAATIITLTGNIFDSDPYSVLASFQSVSENLNGDFGTTVTVAAVATPDLGNGGDGNLIVQLEESLQGMGRGYYNRVQLPVVPPAYAVAATTYDLYKLGFGNATPGSINGVDNQREIMIAYVSGNADGLVFENKINPWLASCPGAFGAVNL